MRKIGISDTDRSRIQAPVKPFAIEGGNICPVPDIDNHGPTLAGK